MSTGIWKASWNGTLVARSGAVRFLDGKQYFPPDSIHKQYFALSMRKTLCPWKGNAGWYHLEMDGLRKPDAAWCYPAPKPAAREIARYIAFSPGVIVEQEKPGSRPPPDKAAHPGKSRRVGAARKRPSPDGFAAKLKQWIR